MAIIEIHKIIEVRYHDHLSEALEDAKKLAELLPNDERFPQAVEVIEMLIEEVDVNKRLGK